MKGRFNNILLNINSLEVIYSSEYSERNGRGRYKVEVAAEGDKISFYEEGELILDNGPTFNAKNQFTWEMLEDRIVLYRNRFNGMTKLFEIDSETNLMISSSEHL